MPPDGWSSLEIAKLAVAAMVPLAVVALGLPITRTLRRVEQAQWAHRKLIELRLGLYAEMAPALNDLYCFFRLVGDFQEITPPEALKRKRVLDKAFYVNEYLMSEEFARRYHAFMNACFLTYTALASPAQLRASLKRQRSERPEWDDAWDELLIPETMTPTGLHELSEHYVALMQTFSNDIGVRSAEPARARSRLRFRTPGA